MQANAASSGATLARAESADGASIWRLTLHAGERTTSREIAVERLTSWSGPCSNEIAYRCTMSADDPTALAFATGLDLVTIERRGKFTVRRIDVSPTGGCRFELHRSTRSEPDRA